jgi:hypothetical protein
MLHPYLHLKNTPMDEPTNHEIAVEMGLHRAKDLVEHCVKIRNKIKELSITEQEKKALCDEISLAIDIIKEFRLTNVGIS